MVSKKSRRAAMAAKAAPTPPAPTSRILTTSLPDVRHDVLDPGVVLEPVHGEVLAVARVLEAAVRHLGDERDVGVDPDDAEVEALGHPHRAAVVLGPHAGGQAVLDAVGPAQRLGLVAELLHGHDRAEDLVLDLLVVLLEAGDDGGLVEVAPLALAGAAGLEVRVVGQAVDHARDALELVDVVERA